MLPLPTGGAYRRPGTLYQGALASATNHAPRLIPFVYSETEVYCLYLSKTVGSTGYVGGFRPTDNLDLTSTVAAITCSGTHPYAQAQASTTSTVGYYDEVFDVQHTQSGDIIYLVHPRYKPRRITRSAADTFAIAEFDNGMTGTTRRDAWPYLPVNSTTAAIYGSATTGSITLTASTGTPFNDDHVGALFKINNAGTIGCVVITGVTSSSIASADVVVTLGAFGVGNTTTEWWESAWSDYRGWPRTVFLFQDRIGYAGTTYNPDSIWFSETGDYNQMSHDFIQNYAVYPPASTADEVRDPRTEPTGLMAFTIELSNAKLNRIQWATADKKLMVGTAQEEFVIDWDSTNDAGFSQDTYIARRESGNGSAYHPPARGNNELFFVTAADDEVRSLVFDSAQQAYVDESVQQFFDHYPVIESVANSSGNRKFRQIAWDPSRKVLWCCDTSGNLFGMTRDRKASITAWHSHQMGGYDSTLTGGTVGSGSTLTIDPAYSVCSGSVVSVAVVPNPFIGTDDVWFVVKRKINSAFTYHIERMIGKNTPYSTAYSYLTNGVGVYYADACKIFFNDYVTGLTVSYAFTGYSHLEGQSVVGTATSTLGMSKVTGSAVASGITNITPSLPNFTTQEWMFAIGLTFSAILEPVRVEAGSQLGTAQGAIKRIHEAHIRFFRTLAAKVGRDADNLETLVFREPDVALNKSAELFTGDKRVKLDSDWDRDGYVYILSDQPLPFTVVSLVVEGNTSD